MDASQIEKAKQEMIQKYGEWTAYSILLAPGVYTVAGKEAPSGRPAHYVRVTQDFMGQSLQNLRVLDLACLEGMFALEFAKHGAQALGIEGRLESVEKARFANRVLGYANCDFVQDDVRNLSAKKYGLFDVVLCCGILYHLDDRDVFVLLERMAEVCKRLVIIDTHVAVDHSVTGKTRLGKKTSYAHKGEKYYGRYYAEFTTESLQQKLKSLWSSLGNNQSFWLERPSLFRAIKAAGFASIYEDLEPHLASAANDRLTFVALKSRS